MATMASNEVSPFTLLTLKGLADGQVSGLNGCVARDCAVKALEGDYLTRSRQVEAKLAQFPKVQAGALGQEFAALSKYLSDSLIKLRSGNYSRVYGDDTPRAIEKQAYANYLRMAQIEAKILDEANAAGDAGVQIDPAVTQALVALGNELTPGQKPLPDSAAPINWVLWGSVGAGVLALGGALWWYAGKKKKAAPIGRIVGWSGGGGRKSRRRRSSR